MRLFLRANLKPAAIGAAITASHREIHHANSGPSVGMNWLRVSSKRLGKTVIMHNGGTGGFHTFIGFTEDRSAGVMVLSNRSESVDSLGASLLEDAAELSPQSAQ
jgi:hypothetical protein